MSVLSFAEARHLVSRTGFGPELDAIQQFHEQGKEQAIKALLSAPVDFAIPAPELHSFQALREMKKGSREERKNSRKLVRQDLKKVKYWAIRQALQNPNALQEKMVWFWHNHFTSSTRSSMRSAELLMGQTTLIRTHAMGNFADLLRAIPYDPLMLIYLDGVKNVRGKPNENFARELLELFTLGEGNYTEQDIKEIARAFTGWRINGKTGAVFLHKKRHDDAEKTVFGETGNFDAEAIIELLLEHPRTAEWIAEKMWAAFISITPPDEATIKRWADAFRESGYDIPTLLQVIFSSDVFWNPAAQSTLIKSPLDLVVGSLRTLELAEYELPVGMIDKQLRRMGQDIYAPPNVKGWLGGMTWVDDFTLPLRQQFVRRLTRGNGKHHDTNMMQAKNKKNAMRLQALPTLAAEHWETWLLSQPAVTDTANDNPRRQLQAILLDPAYQLK